jgi:hypothetical protein
MIFHALAGALDECDLTPPDAASALQAIAYMNFFQRPAERKGESILVRPEDVNVAACVLESVVTILQPQLAHQISDTRFERRQFLTRRHDQQVVDINARKERDGTIQRFMWNFISSLYTP